MITGDHSAIGREIARQVGLGDHIAIASDFADLPVDKAREVVEGADGFAEVYPEHKYRIVALLQEEGHIVGMTGDGVNDAPALKKADVGIAVMGATDAAKSAADIVLTSPGLSVIIDAVIESRKIFQRMNNYAIYRIAETLRVLLFISASIIIFQFYPVTALMIVLLAILNDFPIMTISYDNVRWSSKPERWEMRRVIGIATLLGLLGVMETFALLYIGLDILALDLATLQSFIYLKLSVAGHFCVFMARTKGPFWSIRPAVPLLLAVLVTQLTATVITVYGILMPPIGWPLALLVWGYAAFFFVIIDTVKVVAYRLLDHTGITFRR
jgi:H+-transporting ATPase